MLDSMKKFLGILVLGLILFANTADALRTSFKTGTIHKGEVYWTQNMKFNLPPGKWEVLERWNWAVGNVNARGVTLVQLNGNVADALFEFTEVNTNGKWIGYVVEWLLEVMFKNEHDGCYQRPEYYFLKVKKKGGFLNCLVIRHIDMEKTLYSPDDKERKSSTAIIRKWLRENNIGTPPIMLSRAHSFFAPSVKDSYYGIFYAFNPETHGAPKSKFFTEVSSEYHRGNINNFPKKKKYMDDFVSNAAYEHQQFEKWVRAKSNHLLDFSEFSIKEPTGKIETTSSGLAKELKELYDLYKEGVLTKEQFEKAKKKLLN